MPLITRRSSTRGPLRVSVGRWGTTFAKVLADAGRDVVLWARRAEVAAAIADERRNPEYLPGVDLPAIEVTTTAATALEGADAVVLAVPSQTLRHNRTAWRPLRCTRSTRRRCASSERQAAPW